MNNNSIDSIKTGTGATKKKKKTSKR